MLLAFILILIIGIAAGIIAQRIARPGWPSQPMAGRRRDDLTGALVGIAGAFIGFHLITLVAPSAGPVVLKIAAIVGAALVLWGWRAIRL